MTGGARGNDDGVSGSDFLREATAELYGSDPEEFTERRTALASQARAAGDRAAAKEIAGLRKPTRSAWMINQLVRADPGVAGRLTGLGDELRAAATALDGAKIRELSQERRKLATWRPMNTSQNTTRTGRINSCAGTSQAALPAGWSMMVR